RGLALVLAGGHRHRRHLAGGVARSARRPDAHPQPPSRPTQRRASHPRRGPRAEDHHHLQQTMTRRAIVSVYRKEGVVDLARGRAPAAGRTGAPPATRTSRPVAVRVDLGDLALLLGEAARRAGIGAPRRLYLAQKAFRHTARYEAAIAGYFAQVESKEGAFGV